MSVVNALMQVWVVIDLEEGKAWVFFNNDDAWKKKKSRLKRHQHHEGLPHVFLRKLILGTH